MAEPRWLTDTEQAQWRTLLSTVRLFSRALERQLLRDAGMPHAYYGILVSLNEAPGRRLRMGDLAASVGFSPSRLSHAVARMEQTGWVERHARPSSGRERDAHLTEQGVAALTQAAPGHAALVRDLLFDRLTPAELEGLGALCERIAPGLLDDTDCPAEPDCPTDAACGTESACAAESACVTASDCVAESDSGAESDCGEDSACPTDAACPGAPGGVGSPDAVGG